MQTLFLGSLRLQHPPLPVSFFFFNDTATTEIYTLSLHDALPISLQAPCTRPARPPPTAACCASNWPPGSPHAAPNCATAWSCRASSAKEIGRASCRERV